MMFQSALSSGYIIYLLMSNELEGANYLDILCFLQHILNANSIAR